MPNDRNLFSSTAACFNRSSARLLLLVLFISSASWVAMAATNPQDANARYQAERAVCTSGQSNQSRATCLKEAGAALQEARRGHLRDDPTADSQNASLRCNALPPDDKDACQRRVNGEGTTSGSVLEGGVLHELTVPDRK
ncbi:hypothetical protein [Collimonas antrihumi]|uniref:hypothetical protein n=1 Tax=Collimonas antrihumi TaxID=1940615 RepID=UPI001B8C104E|nr:hypothetical protein [Collimonas antrihumi]